MGWVVGCVGELLLVVAMGLMELVEWMATFPNKFGSDAWVGRFPGILFALESWLRLMVAKLVAVILDVVLVVNGGI